MNGKRNAVWRWPVVLNAAIVSGLAVALLCDAPPARWIARALLGLPLAALAYALRRQ